MELASRAALDTPLRGRESLLPQVRTVPLVLVADVFKHVAVWHQPQWKFEGEGPRVVLRIIERDLQIHVAEVAAAIAFGDVHGFAARVAEGVEPRPVVQAGRVDDKRLALPMPNRAPHTGPVPNLAKR